MLHRPKQRAATANYYIIWVNINTTNSLACFVVEPVSSGLIIKCVFYLYRTWQIIKQEILNDTYALMAPSVKKGFWKKGD